MAFPGTYNFAYYKGDTLEFNVYPKTSNGEPFDLTDFDTAVFNAATARGASTEDLITLIASFSPDKSYINCKILPTTGLQFNQGTTYVYDIQINKGLDVVYTLLNGTISITEQISPNPVSQITVTVPNAPTNLALTENPAGTINANWDAPITGDSPTQYNVYGKAPAGSIPITDYVPLFSISHPTTEFSANSITILGTEYPLETGVEYFIKITSSNTAGENTQDFVEDSITLQVPETVPGTVESLTISSRDIMAGTATLTWDAPASGATVTSYIVAYNEDPQPGDGPQDFIPVPTPIPGNILTYIFEGLTPATPYAFAVIAYAGEEAGTPVVVVDGA